MRFEPLACAGVLCALTSAAHADGWYYEESFGISSARGGDVPSLSTALRLRLGIGWRVGSISLEPWAAGDLTFQRDDAMFGVLGGEPMAGAADLAQFGVDAKYTQPLTAHVAVYMRGGPRFGDGDGSLAHFYGPGVGAGAGIQMSGRVRALGILFAPLFFVNKGPKITAAVFLDQGVDVYWLSTSRTTLELPTVSTNLGFAFGSDF